MKMVRGLVAPSLGVALACFAVSPGAAQGWADALAAEPPTWEFENYELLLEGFAYGAGYTAAKEGGDFVPDQEDSDFVGQAQARLRLQRIYDSGLIVGGWMSFLLAHDELSGDNYGNDTIQKAYLYLQTGFGRLEIGQQDGAAYQVGVTSPTVDDHISLENPDSILFRDSPVFCKCGFLEFDQVAQVTRQNTSSNAAKFTYISPRLFGAQIGFSYTPNLVKAPLPFLGNPSNGPDQQASLVEGVASYNTFVSDIAIGLSAAYTHGALRNPSVMGGGDLSDWSFGLQFAKMIGDVRLSGGVAYRISNGIEFSQYVTGSRKDNRVHTSVMAEWNRFSVGGEFSRTDFGPRTAIIDAYQLAAAYRPNDNLYVSLGWQFYNYNKLDPNFPARPFDEDAGFLSIGYQIP